MVTETICGRILLVATTEARKTCPYLVELNEASSYIWKQLGKGLSTEEIARSAAADYGLSDEIAKESVEAFVSQLLEQHYLIPETEVN